jgi:hypothetical protein
MPDEVDERCPGCERRVQTVLMPAMREPMLLDATPEPDGHWQVVHEAGARIGRFVDRKRFRHLPEAERPRLYLPHNCTRPVTSW